ncbi:Lipase B [Salinisphaera dokdonensis CL-ES53]|uniref:Lipase B n=2 Tax=Salinisphaera TaxID=180541 RepID=A0ABV2AWE0_9GAMM
MGLTMVAHAAPSQEDTATDAAAIMEAAVAAPGPGPGLSVDPALLAEALACNDAGSRDGAVLLVHGTGLTASESWDQTYVPVLTADDYSVCTVRLPMRALADAQVSSEYVVYAVRELYERFGGAVDVITHSQGALEARWAVRFWPDIGDKLDDLIMLSGSNHGTIAADAICLQQLKGCTESVAQQRPGSLFLAALNNGDETPAGPDYSSIYSFTDEIVVTSALNPSPAIAGASNTAVQEICPFRPVSHIQMITDTVAYALVRDALDNEGAADPERIDRKRVCTRLVADGMTPVDALINASTYLPAGASIFLTRGMAEPALKPYALAALPAEAQAPSLRPVRSLLSSAFGLAGSR